MTVDLNAAIREHVEAIRTLRQSSGEYAVTIEVSVRELATIQAALHCWEGSFDQASDERTDWPEWEIASGGDRRFEPLTIPEIRDLRKLLGVEESARG